MRILFANTDPDGFPWEIAHDPYPPHLASHG
jgi:hypothetical protein